ncbi:MAG TPA: hypothetical protein VL051_03470, partial [Burkholderiaceae bacterium]|nr:hypothetical protein [Burkholderiaceae bacterium]
MHILPIFLPKRAESAFCFRAWRFDKFTLISASRTSGSLLKLPLLLKLTVSAWDAAADAAPKSDQKRNMSERSELVSFPDFGAAAAGTRRAAACGR